MNDTPKAAIYVGDAPVKKLFVGDMGIKQVETNNVPLYNRSGGYFYLELFTQKE